MSELDQSKTKSSSVSLTRRQEQCLLLVSEGFSSKEIGIRLEIHYKTVDNHIDFALTKLGMSDRREAGRWIRNRGKFIEKSSQASASEKSPRESEYLVSHSDLAEQSISEKSILKSSGFGSSSAVPLNSSHEEILRNNEFKIETKIDASSLRFFRFLQPKVSIEELNWVQRTTIILHVMIIAGIAMATVTLLFAGSIEILQRST